MLKSARRLGFFIYINFVFFLSLSLSLKAEEREEKVLVVYSSRKAQLIRPVFEAYEKFYHHLSEERKKGGEVASHTDQGNKKAFKKLRPAKIRIKLLTGEAAALIQKMKMEGTNSQVDLFLTVDAGSLYHAKKEGLLFPLKSSSLLNTRIPAHLRDPEGSWFALSLRARPLFYHPKRVRLKELSTYEDLAHARWKKRLCLRTSKKVYTQFLVASLLAHLGKEKATMVVKGWVQNLATKVFFSDTKILKAIEAGQCDVGIANSYYYGRLLRDNPNISVRLFWPDQKGRGTHVNISGVGIVKTSRRKKEAQELIEWLVQAKAQKIFADLNMEHPVSKQVRPHALVQSFGSFKSDHLSLTEVARHMKPAIFLMDKVKYE